MEIAFVAASLNTLLPRLWDARKAGPVVKETIRNNLDAISRESKLLKSALENTNFKRDFSDEAMELKRQARELGQETQDCIQRFFKDKKANCMVFVTKTAEQCKALQDHRDKIIGHSSPDEKATEKPEDPSVHYPTGIDQPVEELLELVKLSNGKRKMISIVGFPGVGKTVLAKQVFDRTANDAAVNEVLAKELDDCTLQVSEDVSTNMSTALMARVTAGAKDASEVLKAILHEFRTQGEHDKLSLEKLIQLVENHLRGKRYLIVIDDMQSIRQWDSMKGAFPENADGTIIVTTTTWSVANLCHSCNGYVYELSPLDEKKSLELFLKGKDLWDSVSVNDKVSDILKKCDGLPLAIVSMSLILQEPTIDGCKDACTQLGKSLLRNDGKLERLRWVLMNKYTGLTCDAVRSCLLYYCLYQHNMDAVPRRNPLIRRWEAEGFLVANNGISKHTDVAAQNLKTLVDRYIMQAMEVGTNGSTRRCRPPGMMVEYISQISISEKFAASVSNAVPSGIRRLSFYPDSATDVKTEDLKLVLTLEVSGIGCEAILDFKKYELIAVLDLKQCDNLDERHVSSICKLLLLKYVSLGKTIGKIPGEMENLKLLETLEMRTNKTVLVYAEITKLPSLKHLIGKFNLIHKPVKSQTVSVLETVTGFVSDTARGFPQLMKHMKLLRKVKIYCSPTASAEEQKSIQKEIKAFTSQSTNEVKCNRSLSIDFAEFNGSTAESKTSPLEFLQESGSLYSLKLRGCWIPLIYLHGNHQTPRYTIPDFGNLSFIRRMCLSGTRLGGEEVLVGLNSLIVLAYLKLEEEDLGPLMIKAGTLQKLERLCLVGGRTLHGITIKPEALPDLVSLHLICKDLDPGLESSIGNGGVKLLAEIALDSEVKDPIKGAWKTASIGHRNRPRVLLIKKGAPIRRA